MVADSGALQARLSLADLLRSKGDVEESIAEYRALLDRQPDHVEALLKLGGVLLETRQLTDAGQILRRALELSPRHCDVLLSLGNLALKERDYLTAEQYYVRVLELDPNYVEAYTNLGHLYTEIRLIEKAIAFCRKAVELKPGFALGWLNLGCALDRAVLHNESLAAYLMAVELDPNLQVAHSNLLFLMSYLPQFLQADVYKESLAWNDRHGAGFSELWRSRPRQPLAGRRLKVGFVSADFKLHPVGYHFLPVAENYDRSAFEFFCYSSSDVFDELTGRISALADHWREAVSLSDESLAGIINDDLVDILVDLSGHSAGNRLLAFVRKPAPVQATWIGYSTTTGLSSIDYLISDRVTIPESEDFLFSEEVMRLPGTRFCYSPPHDAPPPSPPPSVTSGCFTFGSFNNIAKLNSDTLHLWAELLHSMPTSRLLLKWATFDEESVRSRFSALFLGLGITPERIIYEGLSPHTEMLARYSAVDIALDPFPFTGGATTCAALWMGVPVVTLPGSTPISRQTASFLTCIGHEEFIASSRSEYLSIILDLCSDPIRLSALRSRLRAEMSASLLCDGLRFTRNLEQVFLEMWRKRLDHQEIDADTSIAKNEALVLSPRDSRQLAGHWYNDGVDFMATVQNDAAANCFEQAIRLNPGFALAYNNLGIVRFQMGRIREAAELFRRATELDSGNPEPFNNLGRVLTILGEFAGAVAACTKALELNPLYPDAHNNLGFALYRQGFLADAQKRFRTALKLAPVFPLAVNNLGLVEWDRRNIGKATTFFRKAVRLDPRYAEAHGNLANALMMVGRHSEAVASFQRALALNIDSPEIRSNFIFAMSYITRYSQEDIFQESSQWGRRHSRTELAIMNHNNDSSRERRLIIGLCSPDFRRHSCSYFLEPLLKHYDRSRLEIMCYSDVAQPDDHTDRFQGYTDAWRNVYGMPADEMAALIQRDRVDILVDLAGHTAGNRLAVFALKPAPIQVTWIGYSNTTGLNSIDYLISDAVTIPEGEENLYQEKVIRLPGTRLCYASPSHAPEVSLSPFTQKGIITFGSFNNIAKISAETITLWAELLHRIPLARLILKWSAFDDVGIRTRFEKLFVKQGISLQRIVIQGHSPHSEMLALYSQVDIALDTFPFTGGTTTCEALWMGVPVVTLLGQTPISRQSASLLTCIGHPELIAESRAEYLDILENFCSDTDRLISLRSRLRSDMSSSLLCNGVLFSFNLQCAFRDMWRLWLSESRRI